MKKAMAIGVSALVLALAVSPAGAVSLLAGEFQAHFTDGSTLYVPQTGGSAIPRAPLDIDAAGNGAPAGWADTTAQVGDENRTIFSVNQFLQADVPYYSVPSGELTGLLYDLELVAISGDPVNGAAFLYFAPMGRNPVTDPEVGALAAPAGSGGVLEVWLDPTPDGAGTTLFDPAGDGLAPQQWGEGTGPADANHPVGGATDSYPTVNTDDATLWLQAVLVPQMYLDLDGDGFAETPIVLREFVDVTTSSGNSILAYVNITQANGEAQLFERNVYGPGIDMTLTSTFVLPGGAGFLDSPQDIGNWSILSSDPVRANVTGVIPEPTSIALLGLGIAGLAARIRRRK